MLGAWLAGASAIAGESLPAADVGRVFDSWESWRGAYDELAAAIDDFNGLSREPIESPARLATVIEARDRVFRAARDVEGYLYLRLQLDGRDEEALSRRHLLDATDREWYRIGGPWFSRALRELGRETVGEWLESAPALTRYRFFLRRFFDQADHEIPEGQEPLRSLAGILDNQSSRVYNALAVSEAPVIPVTLASGESLELDARRVRTVLEELSSAADREAVSRAWLTALGGQSQTYASLLEGLVRKQRLLAEVRGYGSALAAQFSGDAIAADTVANVVRIARTNAAPLRRYQAVRARALGLAEYGLADRFVPLEGTAGAVPFEVARELIVASSSTLGSEVRRLVDRAFSEGWIDAGERPGKRAHGGSTFVAGHPFVMVNYRGSVDNLFQLTHEIGHAVHSLLSHQSQPFVYRHPSSLTSEAVAGVFEGVLVQEMVRRADARAEKVRALDVSIRNLVRLFYRPMMDAEFELRLYQAEGPMTGRSLDELYRRVVSDFYGDSVTLRDWDAHGWQMTPHFYTAPLYLGRYGLSTAAAQVLLSRLDGAVEAEAAAARHALVDLMRAGSSAYPLELLREAGVDLGDAAAAHRVGERLEALVEELERVAGSDGSPRLEGPPRTRASG